MQPYYQDEHATLYHCDCREILPGLGTFDLLLTDPPYGIQYDRQAAANSGRKSRNGAAFKGVYESSGWDDEPPSFQLIEAAICSAENAIVWGGNYFPFPPSRCWLFWDKENDGKTFADGELAWTNLPGSVRRFRYLWDGMLQKNMGDKKEARVHPTQKPLALMQWCLGFVPDAKTVLDPFAGSGTTLVAAKLEGRQATGIEIDERYCEKAAKRLEQGVLF